MGFALHAHARIEIAVWTFYAIHIFKHVFFRLSSSCTVSHFNITFIMAVTSDALIKTMPIFNKTSVNKLTSWHSFVSFFFVGLMN